MNLQFEIFRRLLLTIAWGVVMVFTFGFPIAAYNKNFYPTDGLVIQNEDDYKRVADYAKSLKWSDRAYQSAIENLRSYHNWKEKRKAGWWLIAAGLISPFLGFGLHRLINWILVHKP